MQKISINLLPVEFKIIQQSEQRFLKIQTISIAVLLLFIFLATTTVALGYIQSQDVKNAQVNLDSAESAVSGLKSKESSLVALKNRINSISEVKKDPSKQRIMYSLVDGLIPANVNVSSLSVDKSGDVVIAAVFSDIQSFDSFTQDLVNRNKNQDKIKEVDIDSLSRSRNGQYRVNLKISNQ